jgi:hypothetical protein
MIKVSKVKSSVAFPVFQLVMARVTVVLPINRRDEVQESESRNTWFTGPGSRPGGAGQGVSG